MLPCCRGESDDPASSFSGVASTLGWHQSVEQLLEEWPAIFGARYSLRHGARGHGVMASLIAAAIDHAGPWGASALEVHLVDTSASGSTRNVFPGTLSAFENAGFLVVERRRPARPIMRCTLDAGRPGCR